MKKFLLTLLLLGILSLCLLSCSKEAPPIDNNKNEDDIPQQSQDDTPILPEITEYEYLRMLIEGKITEGRTLGVSGIAEPIEIVSAFSYPSSSSSLPQELSQEVDCLYLPVVYDEKDIFPDSEGQYIYVMCANSFHSSTWVDGISNIRLDGENLKITFETFNAGYGHEGATYTLSVIKIKKASLTQGVSKADVEYHETTQEEYIAALFNGESARLLVLPDLLADTGIEEIKIVEGAIAERLASNIQPKTATE